MRAARVPAAGHEFTLSQACVALGVPNTVRFGSSGIPVRACAYIRLVADGALCNCDVSNVEGEFMRAGVGWAQIGQWYRHLDKGEPFVVTGCDEVSGTIEIQNLDGDLDEIEQEEWRALPLELSEEPEEGAEADDDLQAGSLGDVRGELTGADRAEAIALRD